MYKWPNGEVTVAAADSADEAVDLLEEIGDTDRAELELMRLPHGARLYVTYQPVADSELPGSAYWTVADDIPHDLIEVLPDEQEALKRWQAAYRT